MATTADISPREVFRRLKAMGRKRNIVGMARFGIRGKKAFGIGVRPLRSLARSIGKNHTLALRLWSSGYLEARILAALIDDPALVTSRQMDRWAEDFDNWAVCDACCSVLFDKTLFAYSKARVWSGRRQEFVKRAAFALMASLAVHHKKAGDRAFTGFFPLIRRASTDNRNYVRKAVNWALRQIGKRNRKLNTRALRLARTIRTLDSPAARWIASDAIRELSAKRTQF